MGDKQGVAVGFALAILVVLALFAFFKPDGVSCSREVKEAGERAVYRDPGT